MSQYNIIFVFYLKFYFLDGSIVFRKNIEKCMKFRDQKFMNKMHSTIINEDGL